MWTRILNLYDCNIYPEQGGGIRSRRLMVLNVVLLLCLMFEYVLCQADIFLCKIYLGLLILKWSQALWEGLTTHCGRMGGCVVPQSVLKARIWVIWRRWWGRGGYKVGERDPLCKGVKTHGVKVACSQGLGVVGTGVEGLGQLVQGAVEGGFEDTGGPHARGQTEGVDDLLWAGVRWQPNPERGGQWWWANILNWSLTVKH